MSTEKVTLGQYINQLRPGAFATLQKVQPVGSLQVRKQSSGSAQFFWRYSIGRVSERVSIGLYDSSAPPKSLARSEKGYSIAAAVRAAEALSTEHNENKSLGGRPALLEARRAHQIARASEEALAARFTLANLLSDYADQLERLGRISHDEARSVFKVHVIEPWPEVAQLPAREITTDHIISMLRSTTDAGKGRTSNKLRSYLRAAFQMAKAARTKASVPASFKSYQIVTNPVLDTEADETQNRADKKPLSVPELRVYWSFIKSLAGLEGAVLRLHLLTGGQRIAQLVRLKTAEIGADSILIYDGKGRPGRPPRPHPIPLLPEAAQALDACGPVGAYALSTDGGETHLAGTTLSDWAVEHAGAIKDFHAKRIRSGVETLLSKQGVSKEIRGYLQSHGVSGVQRRHYDDNDFMPEMRRALEILLQVLEASGETNEISQLVALDLQRAPR